MVILHEKHISLQDEEQLSYPLLNQVYTSMSQVLNYKLGIRCLGVELLVTIVIRSYPYPKAMHLVNKVKKRTDSLE